MLGGISESQIRFIGVDCTILFTAQFDAPSDLISMKFTNFYLFCLDGIEMSNKLKPEELLNFYSAYDDFGEEEDDCDYDEDDVRSNADGSMLGHKRMAMPNIENGRYICDCGKTYKEERYMRHHQRWECGKLPSFHCPYCAYKAKRKNSLKSHLARRHTEYLTKF